MNEEILETEVLINSVRLKALGQLFIVIGESLIGLSSILAQDEKAHCRKTGDDYHLNDFH